MTRKFRVMGYEIPERGCWAVLQRERPGSVSGKIWSETQALGKGVLKGRLLLLPGVG